MTSATKVLFPHVYLHDDSLPLNIQCPSLFDTFPSLIRDLFVPATRSEKRTVAGKLVVSLARQVDHKGELLVLDNMGISLLVPPGAVARGRQQLVSLVLSWEFSDFPHMTNTQALVSPVVYCGPHGLRLDKPCVLSYKHCAFDPRMIQVVSSETELTEEKNWQVMCSAEDSSGKVSLTTDECQIHLQHFSLFACLQTPPEGSSGKKWLQIAAFCAPLHRSVHHYQVRVYFLNKTPCALQWAIQNEAKYGFRLACPEHTFLFDGCGDDVNLTVGYVSRGWCAVREAHHEADSDDEERVSFHAIWHGKCPHLAFCFKRVCLADTPRLLSSSSSSSAAREGLTSDVMSSDTALPALVQTHVREINLDLSIYQHSHRNNPDRINLLLTEVAEPDLTPHPPPSAHDPTCSTPTFLPTCDRHGVSITMPSMHVHGGVIKGKVKLDPHCSGANVLVDFEREADCVEDLPFPSLTKLVGKSCEGQMNVYPQELKVKLKMRLDPPSPFGNDWRMLASSVGLDQWIPWLSSTDNPTLSVLSYMETQQMDLVCLYYKLSDISRCDAASDVQRFLQDREVATVQHGEHSDGHRSATGTSDVMITPILLTLFWVSIVLCVDVFGSMSTVSPKNEKHFGWSSVHLEEERQVLWVVRCSHSWGSFVWEDQTPDCRIGLFVEEPDSSH
ncbi:hypothetical protein C0Q70_07862 [Pomacea canaliculata]|uniref:Netrin receptor UNC5 n=1 Tax=Pomacea canaliculata TaxID=400727 RepID=A0A2T7PG64_POMCA|nr:hypothetical protein C0Q70_07862 [Pomacea canaliculata]